VAAFLASREIDIQAGKGSASQLEIGDAGPNDLPQRQPVEPCREGRERRHQRKADDDRKNPHYFRAAPHCFALALYEPPARRNTAVHAVNEVHNAFIGEPQQWIAPPSPASELVRRARRD
jgi:hypothetical protein